MPLNAILPATRARQHRYNASSVHNHYHVDHHSPPPPATNFVDYHFIFLQSFSNPVDLKIAEAIYIKQRNSFINVKYDEMS